MVENISQTSDVSVTIHSFPYKNMCLCDFVVFIIKGPTTSKSSLLDVPGLYIDKTFLFIANDVDFIRSPDVHVAEYHVNTKENIYVKTSCVFCSMKIPIWGPFLF